MFRTVLISAAVTALLASSSALAAASTAPAANNPNCAALTNPALKKACEAKPPPKACDPSHPGQGNGNGNQCAASN